jgi:Zn-dependent protease
MLLGALDLLRNNPQAFAVLISAFLLTMLVGLSFHEFCHALIADKLGDPTPRRFGRLSLNPVAHLDPIGSLFLLFAGFGWAKPVPVNAYYLRGNPRTGMLLVALAGPLSNLVIASLAAIPFKLGLVSWHSPFQVIGVRSWMADDYLGFFLGTLITLNVMLGVFNLVPIAPLDGFRVALGLLPAPIAAGLARLEPYGMAILFFVAFGLPFFLGINPLFAIIGPVIDAIIVALTGVPRGAF